MRFTSTGNRLSYIGTFLTAGTPPVSADPSLTIWYDAVNSTFSPSGITNGTYITAWGDKSATAHDANTTGNNTNKPRYQTNIQNGKPNVYFDGDNDLFTVNPFSSLQSVSGYTYFIVGKTNSVSKNQIVTVMKGSSGGDIKEAYINFTADGMMIVGGGNTGIATSSFADTNYHIHTLIFDGTQSTNATKLRHRIDGVEQTLKFSVNPGATANAGTNYIYIGTDTAGTNDFDGYLGEVVLYTKKLTESEIKNTEAYFKNKWNVQTITPSKISTNLLLEYDTKNYSSGTSITDSSGNSRTGTIVGSPSHDGSYFTFSDDYILTPSLSSVITAADETHTIECWVYPTSNGVVATYTGITDPFTSYRFSGIEIVSGQVEFGLWNGGSITSTGGTGTLSLNQWHQIVLTYDGTTCKGYVDGFYVGGVGVTFRSQMDDGQNFYIAFGASCVTNQGDGTYFDGKVGTFRIYDGALTAAQISQNYNATKGGFGL